MYISILFACSSLAYAQASDGSGLNVEGQPQAASSLQQADFDPLFFTSSPYGQVDVRQFQQSTPVLPGKYSVDVVVNQRHRQALAVSIIEDGAQALQLCVDSALLKALSLKEKWVNSHQNIVDSGHTGCITLNQWLPQAQYNFNIKNLVLNITIPQAYLKDLPRDYVAPERWQDGDYAAFVDYDFNEYRRRHDDDGRTRRDDYLNVRAGVSLGNIMLRHNGYYQKMDGQKGEYTSSSTYAQTALPAWQSEVRVGDFYANSPFFDSTKIRGIRVNSDERMLPNTLRGYAPVVRGFARSNAKVTIKQKDQIVKEVTVPPGSFMIDNIYALGYGDDLVVTVVEADGQQNVFTVPFSATAQLIRPGYAQYDVAMGKVFYDGHALSDWLLQGDLQYGLNNAMTLNTGYQHYRDFYSMLLGLALNTRIGALSLDYIRNKASGLSDASGLNEANQQWRVSYNKRLSQTDTDIYVNFNRYGQTGVQDLSQYLSWREGSNGTSNHFYHDRHQVRNRWQLRVNQNLPQRWGQVYASGSVQSYWQDANREKSLQLGYNNHFRRLSYDINVGRTTSLETGRNQNSVMLSLSMPLEFGRGNHYVNLNYAHNEHSDTNVMLNGTLDAEQKWHYGVSASQGHDQYAASANTRYRSGMGSVSASMTQSKHSKQASLGLTGGIVAHRAGVTLSESLGETFAIIQAKDAKGGQIRYGNAARLNRWGTGIITNLAPYAVNEVGVNPEGSALNVQLQQTSKQIIPRANTVNFVQFKTSISHSLLLQVTQANGEYLPMGAAVVDANGVNLTFVGQAGRIFLTDAHDSDHVLINWQEDGIEQQCRVDYQLKRKGEVIAYEQQQSVCHQ